MNLNVLDVTKNKLERFPSHFSNLVSLSDLHASENCIEALPEDFGKGRQMSKGLVVYTILYTQTHTPTQTHTRRTHRVSSRALVARCKHAWLTFVVFLSLVVDVTSLSEIVYVLRSHKLKLP